ncbi:hypothetical protein PB1_13259 [Bacillus methanolicus PB1]|uniref:Uncharacterized protein n=1 Tax=Bacillus methanolicus PB1 TaxID=997296 RepID=I3DWA7_BACMT|nr:hypothetical protein [Bacillus methanolicus]EIJ78528.1 hypothetical protein PB1_13259 [Bacillus methanolicus PB1]
MRQIFQLDDKLRTEIMEFEKSCEEICRSQQKKFEDLFNKKRKRLTVELIREKKGKIAAANDIFEENYESYIETGIEEDGEYFPDAYIPVWKCLKKCNNKYRLQCKDEMKWQKSKRANNLSAFNGM